MSEPGFATTPADCVLGTAWLLQGAAHKAADDGNAVFVATWQASLSEAAACMSQTRRDRCLEVQGQHDNTAFKRRVVRLAGSDTAAQLMRARARGHLVTSRLHEMGVPAIRLVERPPPLQATWAGTLVRITADCPTAVATAPVERIQPSPTSTAPAPTTATQHRAAEPPTPHSTYWIEVGTAFDALFHDPAHALGGRGGLGLGWHGEWVYARAFADFAMADERTERVGADFGVALGGRPAPWMQVGIYGRHRITAEVLSDGWIEQGWNLGVEASERLVGWNSGLSIWLTQGIGPAGQAWHRAAYQGDLLLAADPESYSLLRLYAGVFMRQEL